MARETESERKARVERTKERQSRVNRAAHRTDTGDEKLDDANAAASAPQRAARRTRDAENQDPEDAARTAGERKQADQNTGAAPEQTPEQRRATMGRADQEVGPGIEHDDKDKNKRAEFIVNHPSVDINGKRYGTGEKENMRVVTLTHAEAAHQQRHGISLTPKHPRG